MVDLYWLQTQEGQKAYYAWIRKLADEAESRTDVPILVDSLGEIQVRVVLDKKYLSKQQLEALENKEDENVDTLVEFKTKKIIVRELTNIAIRRDSLGATEEVREFFCPLTPLFQGIEEAIITDFCYKAQNAKQLFIDNFKKNLEEGK